MTAKCINPRNDLTAEFVRSILSYDPETGLLRWKISRRPRGKIGSIAGTKRKDGRTQVGINGKLYLAYRLAYLIQTGEWPAAQIDHSNRNPADDRWASIRNATPSQNVCNKGAQKNNKCGKKGVYKRSDCNRWEAQIQVAGKHYRLGLFKTMQEAVAAYEAAAKRLHGEYCG